MGVAKEWFRLQPSEATSQTISDGLKERFGLTQQQKHAPKTRLFNDQQSTGETFRQFVSRMQSLARPINSRKKSWLKSS